MLLVHSWKRVLTTSIGLHRVVISLRHDLLIYVASFTSLASLVTTRQSHHILIPITHYVLLRPYNITSQKGISLNYVCVHTSRGHHAHLCQLCIHICDLVATGYVLLEALGVLNVFVVVYAAILEATLSTFEKPAEAPAKTTAASAALFILRVFAQCAEIKRGLIGLCALVQTTLAELSSCTDSTR